MKNFMHFLCLCVGGKPNGVVGKSVMKIDEDILRWKELIKQKWTFL